MKDSFGGTMMIYILIFFLAIYMFFISLALRYTQAFRIKNAIINIIEQYDGVTDYAGMSPPGSDVETEIKNYLSEVNISPQKLYFNIVDIKGNIEYDKKCYYIVRYEVDWKWPFFNLDSSWWIKGESKNVTNCGKIDRSNLG